MKCGGNGTVDNGIEDMFHSECSSHFVRGCYILPWLKVFPVKKRNKVNYSFLSPIKRCLRLLGISHHKLKDIQRFSWKIFEMSSSFFQSSEQYELDCQHLHNYLSGTCYFFLIILSVFLMQRKFYLNYN